MALFRLPSSGSAALAPRGHGLLLRAPQMSDFLQWAHLREYSRELPDAVGADLAVRRSDPLRLPAAPAPLCRGHRRRPVLSVHRVPGIRRRDDRRRHAGQCPPRHRAGRHHRLLGRATPRPSRLHDGGAAGAAAVAVRRTQSAPHRGRLHSLQCAVDPGAGEMRLRPARAWRGAISASMASGRTTCCSACCTRIFAANLVSGFCRGFQVPWVRRHCAVITRRRGLPSGARMDEMFWGRPDDA